MCSKILHFCVAIKVDHETKTFVEHLDVIIYCIRLIPLKRKFILYLNNHQKNVRQARDLNFPIVKGVIDNWNDINCEDPYSTTDKRANIIFFCNVIIIKKHCRKNVMKMIEKLK